MKKFKIYWDGGNGGNWEYILAETLEDAETAAYERAREDFESNADYSAVEVDADEPEDAED